MGSAVNLIRKNGSLAQESFGNPAVDRRNGKRKIPFTLYNNQLITGNESMKAANFSLFKNAGSDISFSTLSPDFKISLRTVELNLTCMPTVSEIAPLRTQCILRNLRRQHFWLSMQF